MVESRQKQLELTVSDIHHRIIKHIKNQNITTCIEQGFYIKLYSSKQQTSEHPPTVSSEF